MKMCDNKGADHDPVSPWYTTLGQNIDDSNDYGQFPTIMDGYNRMYRECCASVW